MRYLPNLIPPHARVLPDYFKGSIYRPARRSPVWDALRWIAGIIILFMALGFARHPAALLLLAAMGIILLPPGQRLIGRSLRFQLTPRIRTVTLSALFIVALPVCGHYASIDLQEARQEREARKQQEAEALQQQERAAARTALQKDSLNRYLQTGTALADQHQLDKAGMALSHAAALVQDADDRSAVEKLRSAIAVTRTTDFVKAKKYHLAIPELDQLLQANPEDKELLYYRALCYSKTGKIQEAVNDLKPMLAYGNTRATELHDKINPLRKRIIGYVTLCCDGTTSNARGQGACSHHGGVCDWNDPVYEEYRKYE